MTVPILHFPPSFDENPLTYAFALFSLTLIASTSFAEVWSFLIAARRQREIDKMVHNFAPEPRAPSPMSSLIAYRRIIFCFNLMAFIGTAPDAIFLLAWQEVDQTTMEWIYLADRLGDGLAMIPFCCALWLVERFRQTLPQQLAKVVHIPLSPWNWNMQFNQVRIALVVLLIAAGVTLGKASV